MTMLLTGATSCGVAGLNAAPRPAIGRTLLGRGGFAMTMALAVTAGGCMAMTAA